MSSDSEEEDGSLSPASHTQGSSDSASTVKRARISNSYKQSYKSSWETELEFKTWHGRHAKDTTQA